MTTIPARQQLARSRSLEIETGIRAAIDKVCTEQDFEVTYAEINHALLSVLTSNNGYELKALWENETQHT